MGSCSWQPLCLYEQQGEVVIDCKVHGQTGPAILCNHLAESGMDQHECIGWVQAEFDPKNREPGDLMGWCTDCQKIYDEDGGWNELNDGHFKVVCELCFLAIKENQQASAL